MAKRARQHRVSRRNAVTTAVEVLGCAAIAYGSWLIYAPAGYIVAGLLIIAASVMSS